MAVPFSRLADIIEVSKKEMDELGLFASILGHIGDGNFHESIIYNRHDKVQREKVETCVKNMVKRALEMEGTCTGEHSIGWGKKESLVWEVGQETLGVMVRFILIQFWLSILSTAHFFVLCSWPAAFILVHLDTDLFAQRAIKAALDPHWIL